MRCSFQRIDAPPKAQSMWTSWVASWPLANARYVLIAAKTSNIPTWASRPLRKHAQFSRMSHLIWSGMYLRLLTVDHRRWHREPKPGSRSSRGLRGFLSRNKYQFFCPYVVQRSDGIRTIFNFNGALFPVPSNLTMAGYVEITCSPYLPHFEFSAVLS